MIRKQALRLKKNQGFFCLVCVLSLTACAKSMLEVRASGPLKSYVTDKPAAKVGECILFAWQNQSIAGSHEPILYQPRRGGGQSVLEEWLRVFADVYQAGDKTQVDFFTNGGGTTWVTDRRESTLKTCL